MTRLALCSLALAACAGRAAPRATAVPTTAPASHKSYELCRDPAFQCMPAPTKALQVDTNLSNTPRDGVSARG